MNRKQRRAAAKKTVKRPKGVGGGAVNRARKGLSKAILSQEQKAAARELLRDGQVPEGYDVKTGLLVARPPLLGPDGKRIR